jgi:hypothetical protein
MNCFQILELDRRRRHDLGCEGKAVELLCLVLRGVWAGAELLEAALR